MGSIHENQPEKIRADLAGEAAIRKVQEIAKKAENCFFCTTASTNESMSARPMNVRQVDDEGNLWFLSASESHQNEELRLDHSVRLFFQGSPHSDFLQLTGQATVLNDRAKIKELWDPILKTWFTGGVDDPRITVIKVTVIDGYYWDNKHGNFVAGMKMAIGAFDGKTLDDSIEGQVHLQKD